MAQMNFNMADKPDNWPANAIECWLENMYAEIERFIENPSYQNKEVIVSLTSYYDLNQDSKIGLLRTTEYEVAMINSLYLIASSLNFNSLKTYLYEVVGHKARSQKIVSWFPDSNESVEIKEFIGLLPQLKLYYISYLNFTLDKDKSFAYKLIDTVQNAIEFTKNPDSVEDSSDFLAATTSSYISLLNDISYFRCLKRTAIWAFTREEIYDLFSLASNLNRLNGDKPFEPPLKGVLMTSISNYILKSRNDYNSDYICKYISLEVAEKSFLNHEIWMSTIENLNDEREQRVIPELFNDDSWLVHLWANKIDFKPKRNYFVSSFCKSPDDKLMQEEYGQCVYGYKDDRIAEIISPIINRSVRGGKTLPVFSQVITFDLLYNNDEAKNEINFLCSVLDCFELTDGNKRDFLQEILQYWILSVKDENWSHERERRYVIFMYNKYEYREIDTKDTRYLKLKTSLLMQPDFILGDNPAKNHIRFMVDGKRKVISTKPYLFCPNCLNRDFDIIAVHHTSCTSCPVCGSNNVQYEMPNHL